MLFAKARHPGLTEIPAGIFRGVQLPIYPACLLIPENLGNREVSRVALLNGVGRGRDYWRHIGRAAIEQDRDVITALIG